MTRLQDMASERLTRAAYESLYEAVNVKRLIAFVGSGVSLVYGSLTWRNFRDEVIDNTQRAIEKAKSHEKTDARQKAELRRALDALAALRKSDLDEATIVFDLCERAYNLIQRVADRRASGFGQMLREMFLSDRYFAAKTLADRMTWACRRFPKPGGRSQSRNLGSDADFYASLCQFYSADTLDDLAGKAGDRRLLDGLLRELRKGGGLEGPLPIDCRSLLDVFLAFARISPAGESPGRRAAIDKFDRLFPRTAPDKDKSIRLAMPRPLLDPLLTLSRSLGIGRYLTTNYDLELENLFMFDDIRQRTRLPVDVETLDRHPGYWREDEGRSWARRLPNGAVVRSDVYDGVSTSRLFEFAVSSSEKSIHIFHMHGRADWPDTMIATDSDYNRQYRQDRLSRVSFDRAYDVAISGNPILFVGSGMSEGELNRTLRHRVSNQRPDRDSPVYVLRAAEDTPTRLLLEQLTLFTRLGVHVIHYGHPRRGRQWSLRAALLRIEKLAAVYRLDQKIGAREPPWRTVVAASGREKFTGGGSALLDRLKLDAKVVKWLEKRGVQYAWRELIRPLVGDRRNATRIPKPSSKERGHIQTARKLLADYLEKLVEKLRTASLIHELEAIGREAGEYYAWKATPVQPREVWAWPRIGGSTPLGYGVRHLPVVTDPGAASLQWRLRPPRKPPHRIDDLDELLPEGAISPTNDYSVKIIVGDRGTRKGTLLEILAGRLADRKDTLIANCSFGLESDSVILLVESFLLNSPVSPRQPGEHYRSRRHKMRAGLDALAELEATPGQRRPLLVLGAVDWLFGLDGKPLSNEFEWLLRLVLEPPLRMHVLIIGSSRCERYFRKLKKTIARGAPTHEIVRIELDRAGGQDRRAPGDDAIRELLALEPDGRMADELRKKLRIARGEQVGLLVAGLAVDQLAETEHELTDIAPELAGKVSGRDLARLTQEILTALAFIGLPCEGEVLMLAPGVDRLLTSLCRTKKEGVARDVLLFGALDLGLKRNLLKVIEASGEGTAPVGERPAAAAGTPAREAINNRQRFVLHRLLFHQIRNRFGLPLGETLPHSSHSLTLYASQPEDAPAAAPEVAADLALLADSLIAGWPDSEPDSPAAPAITRFRSEREGFTKVKYLEDVRNPDRLAVLDEAIQRLNLSGRLAFAPLRAAGGVIRSVFSASNILSLDVDSLRAASTDRAFVTEQKARIRKLLDQALKLQQVRERLEPRGQGAGDRDALTAIWKDALAYRIGAPAQPGPSQDGGNEDDLFDGHDLSEMLGGALADKGGRQPFYEEEIVWLLNERGALSLAQGDLYAAGTSFELALAANRRLEGDCYHPNRCRILVNRALLSIERGRIGEARRCLADIQTGIRRGEGDAVRRDSTEGRLILALCRGYQALCDDLQGLIEPADFGYRSTIRKLDRLRQQRAIAIFQLHRGAMLQDRPGRQAERAFASALAAAEAGRHTDIAYRIRIAKAELDRRRGTIEPGTALAVHQAAIRYAERFEMHRVAVQALGASTHLRLAMGDIETAAIDCSHALALAARYGLTLSRISLRVLTGRVLEQRGDLANARFMFERAASEAERRGYRQAVDVASRLMMRVA